MIWFLKYTGICYIQLFVYFWINVIQWKFHAFDVFWQECIKWALTNNTISVTWTLVQTKCSQKALPEQMLYKRYLNKKNRISVTWTLNSLLGPCELKLAVKKKNKNTLKYMKSILFFWHEIISILMTSQRHLPHLIFFAHTTKIQRVNKYRPF